MNAAALILVSGRQDVGLWDGAASALVSAAEEALDGVFVTHCSVAGSGPGIADALAAARFFGCDQAVTLLLDARGAWKLPELPPSLELLCEACPSDPESVVAAFGRACAALQGRRVGDLAA